MYSAMTRSFIISFAMIAMSGVSGFALSTVHDQSVVSSAPVLTQPRSAETASGFVIPEFVPVTAVEDAPAPLEVTAKAVVLPMTATDAPAELSVEPGISPDMSLRPVARGTDLAVAPVFKTTIKSTSAFAAPAKSDRVEVMSTRSAAAPMIVAQARHVAPVRAVNPDYVVGVWR